ncbi:MAG: M15 family metallopeptidase [Patescibacteria group bacterium]
MNNKKRPKLVNLADFGLRGFNYYWTRKERYKINDVELKSVGVSDGNAYVDESLIKPLKKVNQALFQHGLELIVKDAYRSSELYKMIQKKRYKVRGKAETDKLLNLETMPHSTGLAVDVGLIDLKSGKELMMRNSKDDPEAFFVEYYRNKLDDQSQEYQQLQELLISAMKRVGFSIGSNGEFWHFELTK